MKVDVVKTDRSKAGTFELDDSVFGAVVREQLFWEVVKMQLASRRRGTHSTKTVSEVRGSGAKPYRQKGTGRARHGNKRGMIMKGGGVVHGPRPRDYSYKLPKKMMQTALRSALSLRKAQDVLHVFSGWAPDAPKTKDALQVLKNFEAPKALVVDVKDNDNLRRSVKNLKEAKFVAVEGINVYDILKYDHLFISEAAAKVLNERLGCEPSRSEQVRKEAARA